MPAKDAVLDMASGSGITIKTRKSQTGFALHTRTRNVNINVHGFIFIIIIAHCHYSDADRLNLVPWSAIGWIVHSNRAEMLGPYYGCLSSGPKIVITSCDKWKFCYFCREEGIIVAVDPHTRHYEDTQMWAPTTFIALIHHSFAH